MTRVEFPSIPIGAKPETTRADRNDAPPAYSQLTLEGLASEPGELLEFGNCLVTSAVTFRKRVKGNEWRCTIHVEPDQEGEYEAVASSEQADRAHSCFAWEALTASTLAIVSWYRERMGMSTHGSSGR